jgi:hypothetical protein
MQIIAATLRGLEAETSPRPKEKAQRSSVKGVISRKKFRRFKFLVKSKESYSDPKGHIVSIMYPTVRLFDMYVNPQGHNPNNTKVRVWCTCPAWQYWGAAFNSTNEKYNLEKKEDRAPDIRDPNRTYKVCKHVLAVYRNINRQTFPRLIDRFIEGYQKVQMEKMKERLWQDQKRKRREEDRLRQQKKSSLEQDDFLEEFVPIEDTFPTILDFLSRSGWSNEASLAFISNLNADNFDSELVRVGAMV